MVTVLRILFLLQLGKWAQDTLATWVSFQLLHNHVTQQFLENYYCCYILLFGRFNLVFTGLTETGKWWNGIKNKKEFGQSKYHVHIASIFCKSGVCYPMHVLCLAVTSVLFRQLLAGKSARGWVLPARSSLLSPWTEVFSVVENYCLNPQLTITGTVYGSLGPCGQ